jgi:dienelactone hydrolase
MRLVLPRVAVYLAATSALLRAAPLAAQRPAGASPDVTRAAFLQTIRRPSAPLAPSAPIRRTDEGHVIEHLTIASEPGERVPLVIYARSGVSGPQPVVVVLHGTGGNKEGMEGQLATLADRGYLAVAMDARHHGGRATPIPGLSNPYESAMLRAYRTGEGHPYLYDTVWDVMRLIDYLVTRGDVDATRIGVIGLSKGGTEAYLAAAADPRIACVVPLIGVQSFGWSLQHAAAWEARVWTFRGAVEAAAALGQERVTTAFVKRFYERIAPGLVDQFDGPAMLPLIAPRALLVVNSDSDPRSPMGGVREAASAAERAYQAAGAAGRFQLLVQKDAAHEVTAEAAETMLQWLDRWLRPPRR